MYSTCSLNLYYHHNMVAPEFSIANKFSVNSQNPYMNQPNPERPPDTAVNIQCGQLLSQTSFGHNSTDTCTIPTV